jgi:cytochrome P450
MTSPDTAAAESGPHVLDLLEPGFRFDGLEVAAARAASWRADTAIGPIILAYNDVVALGRDRRLGSGLAQNLDILGIGDGPLREWWRDMILCLSGERHDRLRRLVVPAFRVPLVEALRPRMREHLAALVADVLDGRDEITCDAVEAIADPYPVAVLADLLDIPQVDRPDVRRWANDIGLAFSFQVAEHLEAIEAAIVGLYGVAERLIEDRHHRPGDDLVSALVAIEADGERLNATELRNIVVTVLFAGHDTTKHQLALALHTLAGDPATWDRLAADPDIAANAVEELMRVAPATPLISRVAHEDVTHRDLTIPAGSRIVLLLGAANRDPAVFDEAPFDVDAERARHVTFGGGVHHCVGHLLARAELAEALRVLPAMLTDVRISGPVSWRPPTGICGPVRLPLRLRRRPDGSNCHALRT